jgi:hypothetical protein
MLDCPIQPWDGLAKDMTAIGSVTIWCDAVSSAYTIQTSNNGSSGWTTLFAIDMATGDKVTSVSAAGRYEIAGGCFIRMNGGSGGTFKLSGEN